MNTVITHILLNPSSPSRLRRTFDQTCPGKPLGDITPVEAVQSRQLRVVKPHTEACPNKYSTQQPDVALNFALMSRESFSWTVWKHLYDNGLICISQHLADAAVLCENFPILEILFQQHAIRCSEEAEEKVCRGQYYPMLKYLAEKCGIYYNGSYITRHGDIAWFSSSPGSKPVSRLGLPITIELQLPPLP